MNALAHITFSEVGLVATVAVLAFLVGVFAVARLRQGTRRG